MGQRAIGIGTIEGVAISTVRTTALDRGVSDRALVLAAGITETRGRAILKGERAATVTEFIDLCEVLHLVAWQVLRDAECGAEKRPLAPVPDLPPEVYGNTPPTYDVERLAAQEGDVEREQEESQETP